MSFTNLFSPLTDIVIVHIFYVNETIPPPTSPPTPPPPLLLGSVRVGSLRAPPIILDAALLPVGRSHSSRLCPCILVMTKGARHLLRHWQHGPNLAKYATTLNKHKNLGRHGPILRKPQRYRPETVARRFFRAGGVVNCF